MGRQTRNTKSKSVIRAPAVQIYYQNGFAIYKIHNTPRKECLGVVTLSVVIVKCFIKIQNPPILFHYKIRVVRRMLEICSRGSRRLSVIIPACMPEQRLILLATFITMNDFLEMLVKGPKWNLLISYRQLINGTPRPENSFLNVTIQKILGQGTGEFLYGLPGKLCFSNLLNRLLQDI